MRRDGNSEGLDVLVMSDVGFRGVEFIEPFLLASYVCRQEDVNRLLHALDVFNCSERGVLADLGKVLMPLIYFLLFLVFHV